MAIDSKRKPVEGYNLSQREQMTGGDMKATDRRIMVCMREQEPFGLRTQIGDAVVIFLPKELCRASYDVNFNKKVIQFGNSEQFAHAIVDAHRIYPFWMGPLAVHEFVTAAQKIINERELSKQVPDQGLPEHGEQAGPVGTGQ